MVDTVLIIGEIEPDVVLAVGCDSMSLVEGDVIPTAGIEEVAVEV